MRTFVIMTLGLALFSCNKSQKHSHNEPVEPDSETSLPSPADSASPSNPQVQPPADLWEKINRYSLKILKKTDFRLASKEKYSLNYQIFIQDGVVYSSLDSMSKSQGKVGCEIEFKYTMFKSRRALKEKDEVFFGSVKSGSNSISSLVGYSSGAAESTNSSRVKNISCRKYSKDPITIADLQSALGSYAVLKAR